MIEANYTVTGMTCDHCARSVTDEISKINTVSDVSVNLPTGAVTVCSSEPVNDVDVRAAVEEAGYELATK
ncbi:heavy-metal-associated domain-containing protein [Saccharopolyspora spinosa]|uniref:heavy-metal-associated domain-containing protein n=1 Tax=Saccharopolyspora spinosa TaxID=60894 RepID=UPI000237B0C3|nr:heavy-metal-associated domain-containing protein [Saccharopolyspora spinosa]